LSEFVEFFSAMMDEYNRHKPEKGETWKTMPHYQLEALVNKHLRDALKPLTVTERMAILVDVAVLNGMSYLRYKEVS